MRRSVLFALALLGAPALAHAEVVERVAAVVDDEIILESELEELAGAAAAEAGGGPKGEVRRKALDRLIDDKLIQKQALELRLQVTSEEIDNALGEIKRQNNIPDDTVFVEALKQQGFTLHAFRQNMKKQLLAHKVLSQAVRSRVAVTDEEVRAFYQQSELKTGEHTSHLRQILVAVAKDAPAEDRERRRRVAEKVVELARSGKSFTELAKAYSDDELTKAEGGDLGWVGGGVLVDALDQAIQGMEPGDVRGPIPTERGYHVLQLVERKNGDLRPFEEVKEPIRRQLYEQQVEKASQAWLKELRKKSHVDVR